MIGKLFKNLQIVLLIILFLSIVKKILDMIVISTQLNVRILDPTISDYIAHIRSHTN